MPYVPSGSDAGVKANDHLCAVCGAAKDPNHARVVDNGQLSYLVERRRRQHYRGVSCALQQYIYVYIFIFFNDGISRASLNTAFQSSLV